MPELTITCTNPDLIRKLFKNAIEDEIKLILSGIKKTEERLSYFENKYKLSTQEFLQRYENDEIEETLELDEWIGEALMFDNLQQDLEELKGFQYKSNF